jgi:polysaccharide deacetylase 2 family uncharacterized protein YibQ
MAKARVASKKKTVVRRKKQRKTPLINVKKVIYALLLFSFFCFSVGMLTYVVFFRMAVAAELHYSAGVGVVFEEPNRPEVIKESETVANKAVPGQCAILIDDMGYHRAIGKKLIELPLHLSFSFLPYAPHTAELEKMAYISGRTVLLHLPLEPKTTEFDPGPGALYLKELSRQEELFHDNLDMVPHAVGVNNHMGSLYTEKREAMAPLMEMMKQKRLFFVDSFTSPASLGHSLAQEYGVKTAKRHVFLDNIEDTAAICRQLELLFSLCRSQGGAIGIGHPHPETLTALRDCVDIDRQDLRLVGVEELVD